MVTNIETVPDLPDDVLVSRASSGNRPAFGLLYDRYLNEIYRYIAYQVQDTFEAEDLTETTFLKAFEKLSTMGDKDEIRNFRAWLYRIAHNSVIDHRRVKKPLVSLDAIFGQKGESPEPEAEYEENEERTKLAQAISKLKPDYQQVILCRFINELSHAETAEIMGSNENHVRVLQYRALKKLQTMLK